MLKRLIPFVTFSALVIAFGAAVWTASSAPHMQIHQSAGANNKSQANSEPKKESTEEAIARYNWWLTLFTAILAVATVGLGGATAGLYFAGVRQLNLARDEFLAAHRPKLIVRDVAVWQNSTAEQTFSGDFSGFREGEKLTGSLVVVNVGEADAKIEFIDKMVHWTQSRLPMRRPYDGRQVNILNPPIVVPAGEGRHIGGLSCRKPMGPEARDVTTCRNDWRLYVMGWIRYRDGRGVQKHMEFCREWHYPDERFRAVSDEHYESEQ